MTTPAGLLDAMRKSIVHLVKDNAVAVAYSGGLDSSIIACLAKESFAVRCYTCAVAGSYDATHAAAFATEDGVELDMIALERESLGGLVSRTGSALNSDDPVRIAYSIPVVCVLERCKESTVLVGSGADEIFGGYAKYSTVADPSEAMTTDLRKALSEDCTLQVVAQAFDKKLVSPFLSEFALRFSDSTPLSLKVSGNDRKILLRDAAKSLGLHSYDRPKKAAQYSSGIMKEMKVQARRSHATLSDWVRQQIWEYGQTRDEHGQSH